MIAFLSTASFAQTNIALNKPTKCSATPVSGSNLAVDGNMGTRWESKQGVDPAFMYVDLGKDTALSKVVLFWEAANAKNYTLDVSHDTITWTTLVPKTNMPGGARSDTLNISGTWRYVRMNGTARNLNYGYSIYEFQIFAGTGTNQAPTVATAAAANPSPVTAATTTLSALGADDGGEANLTYTWATTGTPPAAVTYSANGTNASKSTTATFTKAGSYTFQVTIRDVPGLTVTSSVTVTVNQTLTTVTVSPASASVVTSGTQQFTASGLDQFVTALSSQPTFTWTVTGGGTISASGLFTAGVTVGGPYTVTAASGGKNGTASVSVVSTKYPNATAAGDNMKVDGYTTIAGNLGVGISTVPTAAIEVNGEIKCQSLVIRDWRLRQATKPADYVFEKGYQLPALKKVEEYIAANSHLPGVPSAGEMKQKGVDIIEMNMTLLKKVEELTLYSIEQQKKIDALIQTNTQQQKQIEVINKKVK